MLPYPGNGRNGSGFAPQFAIPTLTAGPVARPVVALTAYGIVFPVDVIPFSGIPKGVRAVAIVGTVNHAWPVKAIRNTRRNRKKLVQVGLSAQVSSFASHVGNGDHGVPGEVMLHIHMPLLRIGLDGPFRNCNYR
jgi:hypothetical protein